MQLIDEILAGKIPAVKEILKTGVDLNQPDKNGLKPLGAAITTGDLHLIKLLLEN